MSELLQMVGQGVRVTVPATTANLGPGFDVLGLALGLHNVIEVRRAEMGVTVTLEGEGEDDLPADRSNLVVRAMEAVFSRTGPPGGGVTVHCVNRIPLGSGLGSSAAAVVGGLLAARALSGWQADEGEVLQLATELEGHGDNAGAALLGGLVLAIPFEGTILARGFAIPTGLEATVFVPDYQLDTAESRRVLPREVSRHDAVLNMGRTGMLLTALAGGEFELLEAAMQDDLHQKYRAPLVRGLDEIIAAARQAGAHGAALSGAGPSVVALHRLGQGSEVGAAMQEAARTAGAGGRVLTMDPGVDGARVEAL